MTKYNLPTNIDATYPDSGVDASVKAHQIQHDTIHGFMHTFDTNFFPQFPDYLNFLDNGGQANGSDQTAAINAFLTQCVSVSKAAYFPALANVDYVFSSITIPHGAQIVGDAPWYNAQGRFGDGSYAIGAGYRHGTWFRSTASSGVAVNFATVGNISTTILSNVGFAGPGSGFAACIDHHQGTHTSLKYSRWNNVYICDWFLGLQLRNAYQNEFGNCVLRGNTYGLILGTGASGDAVNANLFTNIDLTANDVALSAKGAQANHFVGGTAEANGVALGTPWYLGNVADGAAAIGNVFSAFYFEDTSTSNGIVINGDFNAIRDSYVGHVPVTVNGNSNVYDNNDTQIGVTFNGTKNIFIGGTTGYFSDGDLTGSTVRLDGLGAQVPSLVAGAGGVTSGGPVSGTAATVVANTAASNLLDATSASYETTGGWGVNSNCAVAQDASHAVSGTHSVKATVTASGTASIIQVYGHVVTGIVPGSSYTLIASGKGATAMQSYAVRILWYTVADVFISSTTGTPVAGNITTWVQPFVTASAPALAAKARMQINIASTAAPAEVHYFDAVMFTATTSNSFTYVDPGAGPAALTVLSSVPGSPPPSGGMYLYLQSGQLKAQNASGTVTVLA